MDNPDQYREQVAAAVRPKYEEEPGGQVSPGIQPRQRERLDFEFGGKGATFARYETTNGYVTVSNANTIIIHFQGVPAEIEIFVLNNPVMVSFLDETQEAKDEIRIEANNFYLSRIRSHKVQARNALPDNQAAIQIVGKWSAEYSQEVEYGR